MRHGVKTNNLSRKIGHRIALKKNLANALITHKRINTTLAKAKVLRAFLEPLVTKSKDNSQHSRRIVFSYLMNKYAVTELFDVIGPKIMDRPGGYLRIIKTGFRKGDGAETAMIEFVDFNEVYNKTQVETPKKKTRRSKVAKTTTESAANANTEASDVAAEDTEETKTAE